MNLIDQYKAAASLEKALIPSPSLIDGRSETDRLAFISELGSLLNFYDHTNTVNGNWEPFLLKDPVFLVARISKTNFSKSYLRFKNTCSRLNTLLATNTFSNDKTFSADNLPGQLVTYLNDITFTINDLLDQLTGIFVEIARWTRFMEPGSETYPLKTYILRQVKENFSNVFQGLIQLRQYLSSTLLLGNIKPPHEWINNIFNLWAWQQSSNQNPYWEALKINLTDEQLTDGKTKENEATILPIAIGIASGLQTTGNSLFGFYKTSIQQAVKEYESIKHKKSRYPDTTLLRAFIHLLQVHQEQLNSISKKHLEFYYTDILKQSKMAAIADQVFVSAVLSKTATVFNLPAGTPFNAGTDANKNTILFNSTENVSLNAATITQAITLSQLQSTDAPIQFNLQQIPAPGKLISDEYGVAQSWSTFGGYPPVPVQTSPGTITSKPIATTLSGTTTPTSVGFAFASPMLLLTEGTRTLTINITFSQNISSSILNNASFFLSTAQTWASFGFAATAVSNPPTVAVQTSDTKEQIEVILAKNPGAVPIYLNDNPTTYSLTLTLQPTDPAIEAFAKNPDGLTASWPMMKIVFDSLSALKSPPIIYAINISVNVINMQSFVLYNDNGLLSSKSPFQPFGPIPAVNTNFVIGNSEIFSKPISNFSVTLNWNNLPADFVAYYQIYNTYIQWLFTQPIANGGGGGKASLPSGAGAHASTTAPPQSKDKKGIFSRMGASIAKQGGKVVKGIANFGKFIGNAGLSGLSKLGIIGKVSSAVIAAAENIELKLESSDSGPEVFSNTCFQVQLNLYEGTTNGWSALPVTVSTASVTPSATASTTNSLFATVTGPSYPLPVSPSIFTYESTSPLPINQINPFIQQSPLVFTESSTYGFLKMNLIEPSYGFGASIYGAVVTYIALQNALIIKGTGTLLPAPNVPYAPKLTNLTGTYNASVNYLLNQAVSNEYPLECFYYSPFANYTVYDNSPDTTFNGTVFNTIGGSNQNTNGLYLYPAFSVDGSLFICFDNLIPGNTIRLYFQLSQGYAGTAVTQNLNYFYLTENGWLPLTVMEDGTNGLSCSGILVVNVPLDIVNESVIMPNGYWIAIAETGDPASFPQTVLIAPNGIQLERAGTSFLQSNTAPSIAAGVITKTQSSIAQIASVTQPFASFGGKAAETQNEMNLRVSRRLKTKDRVINNTDLYTVIRQNFPDIYYAQMNYSPATESMQLYLVRKFLNAGLPNAFLPLVTECEEKEIREFLIERVPTSFQINVSNYNYLYITVKSQINILPDYSWQTIQNSILNSINLFFSPWIGSTTLEQLPIGEGFDETRIGSIIMNTAGIASIQSIEINYHTNQQKKQSLPSVTILSPGTVLSPGTGQLFVSSMQHQILAA
jgi:hypothetical protein